MAVISLEHGDLCRLMGREIPLEELLDILPMMGSDLDSVEGSVLNVEFFPNRPDLYSVEGVARALRAFTGQRPGLVEYPVARGKTVLRVDSSVEAVRPYIVAGVVRGVEMSDPLIASLMEAQEKLHLTLGRRRKKVAIGVHDMRDIRPPFVYRAVEPSSIRFAPLGYTVEMDMAEILARHEKGQEYAWVLEGMERYPIILDADQKVLSFPPIINGTVTAVTESTTDIFLDLTGTDMNSLRTALNIIATMLAERGGRIEAVDVEYPDRTITLPDLTPRERMLDVGYANGLLGTDYSPEQVAAFLERMGHGASPGPGGIRVRVPAYRHDIIHPVDLVEDVAIGAGFGNIVDSLPREMTFGAGLPLEGISGMARDCLVGMSYLEIKSLALSSREEQFGMMLRPASDDLAAVLNPINEYLTCVRLSLLPGMLAFLRANKHRDLPQNIFEIGDVVKGRETVRHVAALSLHSRASFTEAKSAVQALLGYMDTEFALTPSEDPAFIPGRAASILVAGREIGVFGEIHPQVLENFGLGYPAAGFEIDISGL